MSAIASPFIHGQNAAVFDAMLDDRFRFWARQRRNRLARSRRAEVRRERERVKRRDPDEDRFLTGY